MLSEVRYAVRALLKSKSFTIASVATLGVAIGANTAMFSVVNSVLLRPLPYYAPEHLAMLWTESPSENLREGRSGYWNIEAWRRSRSFSEMAVFDAVSATLTGAQAAERVTVARISPDFLSVLGVQPVQGRMFSSEEAEGRQRVALISYDFWQTHFARSPEAFGASIELNGLPSRVIGVLPEGFQFPKLDAEVWEPHTLFPDWAARRTVRGVDTWSVVGRLRPEVSFNQARAEMAVIARSLDQEMPPAERNREIGVMPLTLHVLGPKSRSALWMLSAAVFCVLLIAAANVISLSLARNISRAREFAIRAALGASAFRIMRQLIAESLMLALVSGGIGGLLALGAIRSIRALNPATVGLPPRLHEISLDLHVLTVALAISVLAGVLVGLAPGAIIWRRNLRASASAGRTVSAGVDAGRLRRTLVVSEFAVAMVLLFAAGLLVRSWREAGKVDPGFRPERVVTMDVRTPVRMAPPQRANFYREVLQAVTSVPGVESAGFTSDLFISSTRDQVVTTEGDTRLIPERLPLRVDEVSPDFFNAAGTPLISGRFFSEGDGAGSSRVALVNTAFARRIWKDTDPVGRRLKLGSAASDAHWFTVVGVVADMRRQGVEREPVAQMFECVAQNPSGSGTLLIRTRTDDPLTRVPDIQAAVRRVDRNAPLYGTTTLELKLAAFLLPRRFQTSLVVAFSAIALILAAIGIYGLVQYSVAARTREIGIRISVGAHRGTIFRMIFGEGLKLSLAGVVVGSAGAILVGRISSSLLFGVTGTDPVTFLVVAVLLMTISGLACYLPARRAMNVEPITALRDQ